MNPTNIRIPEDYEEQEEDHFSAEVNLTLFNDDSKSNSLHP